MWRDSLGLNLIFASLALAGLYYIVLPLIKAIYWDNMINRSKQGDNHDKR